MSRARPVWPLITACILILNLLAPVGMPAPAAAAAPGAAPSSVTIAGSLQSELGCPGDWDPACAATHLAYDANDDVWQGSWTIPAGNFEYKAALNDSWTENYGLNATPNGANIPLSLSASSAVKFYYDHKSHWITDNQNSVIATVPGSFQSELGCSGDWDPGCLRSWLEDPDGDGIYSFETQAIPAGSYEAKVAINETWDENYGQGGVLNGANIPFSVPTDGMKVVFRYDPATHILSISAGHGHDNNVEWDGLGHDSRDPLYRTPTGPVPAGTAVTLRLRAFSKDLTEARVRVWDDRTDSQMFLKMHLAADDGAYEWWEITLPPSALPTVYWYRFIAIDGLARAYYEDDAARDGGWGQTYSASPDQSWQLTMYDPAFHTPDWIKNAIVYQIFPDRFRDGATANDTPAGTFFYNEPGGTIYRSNASAWNTSICDPRDPSACPGEYSNNFYGGDLQGLRGKLDTLQNLGITAVYLNPIFESPSNHKYDTTDYSLVDDAFGDLNTFISLTQEAHARGIHVILDGVFNHTSSDSIYFDRYGRYASVGACESASSPYRSWYFFHDVEAGAGACAGSDGTPNAATYESWFGYDSLPKLNSANPGVRSLIWAGGANSIARKWMQYADGWRLDVGGDVDPGTLNDPNNDYWEGFRAAVHQTNPDAYIVGEEWGNATSWTLGGEWDATMNYPFGAALLSFWRDTTFVDNDHNSGSSAGELSPLSPSQLNARLLNLQERYAPEAFAAMMNLLDSHDTNRALFELDHNAANGTNDALLQNPNYDWSDAIARLKGVALLQMTLPGAPTIYYGDEVGLVGPVAYDSANNTWQDDPYNRQPYPWLDESGTPFYTHLQTQAGQDVLRNYYELLTTARNDHPALRTGSFDPLKVDDAARVYVYGRRLTGMENDAAVVLVNRATAPQTISVDLRGYLPTGAQFTDALTGSDYTVDSQGLLTVGDVPARLGALLVLTAGEVTPPAAPTGLDASEGPSQVDLSWDASAGAAGYAVYRSLLSGGGYTLVLTTTATTAADSGLTNGQKYYYVVQAVSGTGLASGYSEEVSAIPHYPIGWANLQWPPTIDHTIGITPTENIYGQVWIDLVTVLPGATPNLTAQVGFGPQGTQPISWTNWVDASFNTDAGNNDEFKGQLVPEETGVFNYVYRYSTTGGRDWFYADLSGPIQPTAMANPGVLTVTASSDVTPPAAPTNLHVTDWASDFISLAWDPVTGDDSLYAYDIYRAEAGGVTGKIDRVLAPETTYMDISVETGKTYTYTVRAVDTSFNRSGFSNEATGTAETKTVAVTFRVRVPDFTPGTVYLAGNLPGIPQWNPGATPMTEVSPNVWEITLQIPDGFAGQYKYTRGSWDTVEWWGTIHDLTNRNVVVAYGASGQQLVDDTNTNWEDGTVPDDHKAVQDWRDPIVVSITPPDGALNVPVNTSVSVVWSHAMISQTVSLTGPDGPVAGVNTYLSATHTVVFTPTLPLLANADYTVKEAGQLDYKSFPQQVPASATFHTILPTVQFSQAAYSAAEGGMATITVTLNLPSAAEATVAYAEQGGTNPISGTLTFAPGETVQTFTVNLAENSLYGANPARTFVLSSPSGATLGAPTTATLTTGDNEHAYYFPWIRHNP